MKRNLFSKYSTCLLSKRLFDYSIPSSPNNFILLIDTRENYRINEK